MAADNGRTTFFGIHLTKKEPMKAWMGPEAYHHGCEQQRLILKHATMVGMDATVEMTTFDPTIGPINCNLVVFPHKQNFVSLDNLILTEETTFRLTHGESVSLCGQLVVRSQK